MPPKLASARSFMVRTNASNSSAAVTDRPIRPARRRRPLVVMSRATMRRNASSSRALSVGAGASVEPGAGSGQHHRNRAQSSWAAPCTTFASLSGRNGAEDADGQMRETGRPRILEAIEAIAPAAMACEPQLALAAVARIAIELAEPAAKLVAVEKEPGRMLAQQRADRRRVRAGDEQARRRVAFDGADEIEHGLLRAGLARRRARRPGRPTAPAARAIRSSACGQRRLPISAAVTASSVPAT